MRKVQSDQQRLYSVSLSKSSLQKNKRSQSAVSQTLSLGSLVFSICGFSLQLPPLFLSFSISRRQQSANGPVFILLQLRKKTLCFFFFHPADHLSRIVDLLDAPLKPHNPLQQLLHYRSARSLPLVINDISPHYNSYFYTALRR